MSLENDLPSFEDVAAKVTADIAAGAILGVEPTPEPAPAPKVKVEPMAKPAPKAAPSKALAEPDPAPVEPAPAPEPTPEPGTVTKTPEEVADAYAKAALENGRARKARQAAKAAEQAAQAKMQTLAAQEKELADWRAKVAAAKGDPEKARALLEKDLGVTYAQETEHYVRNLKDPPTVDQKIAAMQKEIADARAALAERDAALEKKSQEQALLAAEERQREMDTHFTQLAVKHVKDNPEKYEMLNALPDEAPGVYTLIKAAFFDGIPSQGIPKGTELTFDKAAEMLDDYLYKTYEPLTKVKKLFPGEKVDAESPKPKAKPANKGLSNEKVATPAELSPEVNLDDEDAEIARVVAKTKAFANSLRTKR